MQCCSAAVRQCGSAAVLQCCSATVLQCCGACLWRTLRKLAEERTYNDIEAAIAAAEAAAKEDGTQQRLQNRATGDVVAPILSIPLVPCRAGLEPRTDEDVATDDVRHAADLLEIASIQVHVVGPGDLVGIEGAEAQQSAQTE